MKVLTFQSRDVSDILLKYGVYEASLDKARESSDHSDVIAELYGKVPIWVFSLGFGKSWRYRQFVSGQVFRTFQTELAMSDEKFYALYLLELEVPECLVVTPKTDKHYVSHLAKVIPGIKLDWLNAVYSLNNSKSYFKPDVSVTHMHNKNALFPNGLSCHKIYPKGIREPALVDTYSSPIYCCNNCDKLLSFDEIGFSVELNVDGDEARNLACPNCRSSNISMRDVPPDCEVIAHPSKEQILQLEKSGRRWEYAADSIYSIAVYK